MHPILLALFAVCRRRPTIQVQQAENSARSNLVSQMQSATRLRSPGAMHGAELGLYDLGISL